MTYWCAEVCPGSVQQITFANTIDSLLLSLLKKKYYAPFPPNEIEKMIDNVLFMLASQVWGSFHINRIYDSYNSSCPGFLIKFRSFTRSAGVRQLWKASWITQTCRWAGLGKYFYFSLYFIYFPDTKWTLMASVLHPWKDWALDHLCEIFLLEKKSKWDFVWNLLPKCKKKKIL